MILHGNRTGKKSYPPLPGIMNTFVVHQPLFRLVAHSLLHGINHPPSLQLARRTTLKSQSHNILYFNYQAPPKVIEK